MNTFPIDDQLILLIDRLNNAINVSNESVNEKGKGYPFATGYSSSAMSSVADDLSKIVKQIREKVETVKVQSLI